MTWYNNSLNYRKAITISNSGSVLSDYQVLIAVDTTSLITTKMRSDCGDIRFTSSDGSTLLNYWIESGINSSSTRIWVKIPSIVNGNNTIYLYYGNSSATSLSSGTNTFLFFDDFNRADGAVGNNWNIVQGTWSITSGELAQTSISPGTLEIYNTSYTGTDYIVEAKGKIIDEYNDNTGVHLAARFKPPYTTRSTDYYHGGFFRQYNTATKMWEINGDRITTNVDWIFGTFYNMKLVVQGNNISYYNNGILKHSLISTTISSGYAGLMTEAIHARYDDFRVRKYALQEPTTCVGGEEVSTVSWLTNWNRRKLITITGSTSSSQTDYQMKIIAHKSSGTDTSTDIYLGSNVNNDFSDLRFTKNDGTTILNYWIESYTSGSVATVWIKVPEAPASPCTTTIYVYYSNSSATSLSNGTNTFVDFTHFDDLTGWTQQTGTWSVSNSNLITHQTVEQANYLRRNAALPTPPYMASFRIRNTVERLNSARGPMFESNNPLNVNNSIMWVLNTQTNLFANNVNSDWASTSAITDANTWYIGNLLIKTGDNVATVYSDGRASLIASKTNASNSSGTGHYYGVGVWASDADMEIDWIFIRKYTSPEPTFSIIGTEEILATPANITATSLIITPSIPCISGSCIVTVDIIWTNTGETSGTFTPSIKIDTVPIVVDPPLNPAIVSPSGTKSQQFIISGLTTGIHTICPDPN